MEIKNKAKLISIAAGMGLLYAAASAAVRKLREYDLKGKSVLITGGSRGLGLLLAREFARQNARVTICARNRETLDRAREDLEHSGLKVETVVCDLTRKDSIDSMLEEVANRMGSIDVLVNNAGFMQVGPIETMGSEDFDKSMKIHFWAPLHATMGVLPGMIRRKEGRIVNISSIGGKISIPHLVPYSAGKFALTGLSEGLRPELAKHNIAVTTVCPGLMRTGSPRNAQFKGRHRSEYAWFSIAASLPVLSMDATRAARRIVRACIAGEAELVLSVPAQMAVKLCSLFPSISEDMLEFANLLLPEAGGIGKQSALGKDSESRLSKSWLTELGEKAARQNNQIQ